MDFIYFDIDIMQPNNCHALLLYIMRCTSCSNYKNLTSFHKYMYTSLLHLTNQKRTEILSNKISILVKS